MNKNKKLELTVTTTDFVALSSSYVVSTFVYLVIYKDNEIFFKTSFLHTFSYFIMAFIITNFFTMSKNRLFLERNRVEEVYNLIKNDIIIAITFTFLTFIMRDSLEVSRGVFFITLIIFLLVGTIGRFSIKKKYGFNKKNNMSKIIIITTYNKALSIELMSKIEKGLFAEIVGLIIIDKSCVGEVLNGYKVVSNYENALKYCQIEIVDSALILLNNDEWKRVEPIVESMQSMGIIIHLGIDVLSRYGHFNRAINFVGNYPVLSYAETLPHEESLIIKRIIDILGGIVGSIIAVFVMLFLGPIIKLESPGPIFFKQKRVGKNGRYFNIYKFRSMGIDAEQRKKDLMAQNEVDGHMFKMTNDPRVTKIGKFIRATSIDELPQFFNVLKGDMSLVGTRPPTISEFEHYEAHHKRRLSMKPGITGMWQVSGRSDITDFEEVVRLDLQYIDNYSLIMDAKILSKTLIVVFAKIGSR